MWKFILLQLHVIGGLTLIFSSFSSESRGGEKERESDAWMNTGFVHLSHVDLIWSCLLGDRAADMSAMTPSADIHTVFTHNLNIKYINISLIDENDKHTLEQIHEHMST